MSEPNGAKRPRHRQLTIGECLAVGIYGPTIEAEKGEERHLRAILALLDSLEVCTACGWSLRIHQVHPRGVRAMHLCAHYERHL